MCELKSMSAHPAMKDLVNMGASSSGATYGGVLPSIGKSGAALSLPATLHRDERDLADQWAR
jgi:hypothetical protein